MVKGGRGDGRIWEQRFYVPSLCNFDYTHHVVVHQVFGDFVDHHVFMPPAPTLKRDAVQASSSRK